MKGSKYNEEIDKYFEKMVKKLSNAETAACYNGLAFDDIYGAEELSNYSNDEIGMLLALFAIKSRIKDESYFSGVRKHYSPADFIKLLISSGYQFGKTAEVYRDKVDSYIEKAAVKGDAGYVLWQWEDYYIVAEEEEASGIQTSAEYAISGDGFFEEILEEREGGEVDDYREARKIKDEVFAASEKYINEAFDALKWDESVRDNWKEEHCFNVYMETEYEEESDPRASYLTYKQAEAYLKKAYKDYMTGKGIPDCSGNIIKASDADEHNSSLKSVWVAYSEYSDRIIKQDGKSDYAGDVMNYLEHMPFDSAESAAAYIKEHGLEEKDYEPREATDFADDGSGNDWKLIASSRGSSIAIANYDGKRKGIAFKAGEVFDHSYGYDYND